MLRFLNGIVTGGREGEGREEERDCGMEKERESRKEQLHYNICLPTNSATQTPESSAPPTMTGTFSNHVY